MPIDFLPSDRGIHAGVDEAVSRPLRGLSQPIGPHMLRLNGTRCGVFIGTPSCLAALLAMGSSRVATTMTTMCVLLEARMRICARVGTGWASLGSAPVDEPNGTLRMRCPQGCAVCRASADPFLFFQPIIYHLPRRMYVLHTATSNDSRALPWCWFGCSAAWRPDTYLSSFCLVRNRLGYSASTVGSPPTLEL